jgi:hypothetical protein
MTILARPLVQLLVASLIATTSAAQSVPSTPLVIEDAGRDKSGDEPFDVPELYGTQPFVAGAAKALPKVIVEYAVDAGAVFHRLSIFDNGVAAIHIRGNGPEVRKKLILPADALQLYREQVSQLPLEELPRWQKAGGFSGENQSVLRILRNDAIEERTFASTAVLPRQVENFRQLLDDLFAAIASDEQITNPLANYVPTPGDRLVSIDQHLYEVKRIVSDGTIVELQLVGKPTRTYVPTELLYKMFVKRSVREQ